MTTVTNDRTFSTPQALLPRVREPSDLRGLTYLQLDRLAAEIRLFLIEAVAARGGHLGPNLGVVEITIAVHRVFDSPRDAILFDTGHQAYVHKLLTGRQAGFTKLRQRGGLSGYPSRAESPHDHVENSHASTALAYADGLAKAYRLQGRTDCAVVAVVGDGALTGGLAWEALNNLGAAGDRPVIVVLNDNGRSYAPTVGGIARHLAELRTAGEDARPDSLFENLGFAYLGPVDGHDEPAVERALRSARRLRRPVVVHCVTRKGYGYLPAEADQDDHLHTIGVVDPRSGRPTAAPAQTWTDVFSREIRELGKRRSDLVCVTAAMPGPTGLAPFARDFPDRTFDVGIAEQHAVTSAAGLAMAGLHPVVALYATFLNRAIDQLLLDVALHRLPVTFVLDRAGITGPDGPSHHGMWDLSLLSVVPGIRIAAPRDPSTLRDLLHEALDIDDGPTVLRFPKATTGPDLPAVQRHDGLDVLRRSETDDVLLIAVGSAAGPCLDAADRLAADGIGSTVVDPRWVFPLGDGLTRLAARHRLVVTVEDNERVGGIGSAVGQSCADAGIRTAVESIGLPRSFIHQGSRGDLLADLGLDGEAIAGAVAARLTDLDGVENRDR